MHGPRMAQKLRISGTQKLNRGAILAAAIIILLTISLIGATLASFFLSVSTTAETELARAQALYLAEAGITQAISQLRSAGLMGGAAPQHLPPTPLGEGTYEVTHDVVTGVITSTGAVRDVRRTVQVKYYPF